MIVWRLNRSGEFDFACLIAGHFQALPDQQGAGPARIACAPIGDTAPIASNSGCGCGCERLVQPHGVFP